MKSFFSPEKQEINIDASQFTVSPDRVLKSLGMKHSNADDYLLELIDKLSIKCIKLAKPRAGFSLFSNPEFDKINYNLSIKGNHFKLGKIVTSMLKKSEAVIFFAVTVGHNLEAFSNQQMKDGNALEGLIIDLVGSELAESATDFLYDSLQKQITKKGYSLSNRYSPGYCNWPVSDQHKLFELLSDVNCGIKLNSAALMTPIKSVSGIIGVGKELKRVDYKCRLCDDKDCILRHQF